MDPIDPMAPPSIPGGNGFEVCSWHHVDQILELSQEDGLPWPTGPLMAAGPTWVVTSPAMDSNGRCGKILMAREIKISKKILTNSVRKPHMFNAFSITHRIHGWYIC
jgi:hypothetical protein